MTRLVNSNVAEILSQINQYKKTVQDAFYEQYKNIFILTQTNNFRGEGADAYKEYLLSVTINYINTFINISEQVSATIEKMHSSYIALENSEQGSIDTSTVEEVRRNLNSKNEKFQYLVEEIDELNREAAQYISVRGLNSSDISATYSNIDTELYNICDDLTKADEAALKEANNLFEEINELANQLKTIANDYHKDKKISADMVKDIPSQQWYKTESNKNLSLLMKEDPFFYSANAKYRSEGQWAKGATSDVYIYGGYSAYGGAYTANTNDGVSSLDANGSLFNAYEAAQATKYFRQNANLSLGAAAVSGKMGFSKNYIGFQGKGSVAAVDANASVVLGTDKFNGYAKGNATFLSASGYTNCYVNPSNGDFDIGIGGKATAAEASFSLGTSILTVPAQNSSSQEYIGGLVKVSKSTSLLAGSIKAKVGAGGSADFDLSSTKVLDFGEINVNALHVKLGGALGIGLDVDVTIPVPTIDLPWES
ncbi:T7SS effector LXG polymorphic toxin [Clostridium manihotivorum]|uniref:T7SS effector LXG polymorphic toxin n=1 Tax=Clostridium manihotivorum TaxID=2320868 RepID=UPI0013E3A2C6|nr:T7SS effector LXG polymorphic toxin [Clostridium manihotivorum]